MNEFWMHAENQDKPEKKQEKMEDRLPKDSKWKKGQSGNPLGRPPLTPDQKAFRDFNTHILKRMIGKSFSLKQEELSAIIANPESPAIEVFIARTIMLSLEKGDPIRAEFLFKRSLGNVQENIKLGVKNLRNKSIDEKMEAGKAAIQFLEAQKLQKSDDDDLDDEDCE